MTVDRFYVVYNLADQYICIRREIGLLSDPKLLKLSQLCDLHLKKEFI